ncbi:glycoside hydrolase family 13 protein [Candidatus Soleaferrea massiliensis]|uniref:glycoside hydrolase family 13 protein n=1 Tax=Candidatus Soleaferrea massiliensis TaxID=1470354 RepID=UPI00058DA997|nr:glycoside hydrolase family 13 protein [Candidatus Soleaferrea massiliensis]
MDECVFDSRDLSYKTPFGAVRTDEEVTFRLKLPKYYRKPYLIVYQVDRWDSPQFFLMHLTRSEVGYNEFSCRFRSDSPMLYFYCFKAVSCDREVMIKRASGSKGKLDCPDGELWQLTVYDKDFKTPERFKGGIIYQIFPDRFYSSGAEKSGVPADRTMHETWDEEPVYLPDAKGKVTNSDYFGGDLRGIEQKLDYIQSLGADTIYLNPVFEAHSNHRYNTANFMKIDPLLGSNEDFKHLCEAAKEKGIKIILDGVFSHVGSDSVYFNKENRYDVKGAYNSEDSRYRDWFKFIRYPDSYHSWWGFETLPEIDEDNENYTDFICGKNGVLRYWLEQGAAGYRLDVADELPDRFLDRLHDAVKGGDEEAIIIGEVWEDASNKVSYGVRRRYFLGEQLDSVMNYPFKDAVLSYVRSGNAAHLNDTILTVLENYPKPVVDVLMNSVSTHDTERAITNLAGEPLAHYGREWQASHALSPIQYHHGVQLLKLSFVLQYFLPGVPCLYYGDEIGMQGYKDPFNRRPFAWDHIDEELLAFTRELGRVRSECAFLKDALYKPYLCDDHIFSFIRHSGEQRLLIAVNRTDLELTMELEQKIRCGQLHIGGGLDGNRMILPPYGYAVVSFQIVE